MLRYPIVLILACDAVTWVPEAFHARFPISVKSQSDPREKRFFFLAASPLASSAFGQTRVGLRPTKRNFPSHARRKLWYLG